MSLTEAQLAAKFKASGRNWDQLCQAAVWNACNWSGGAKGTYASANTAYHASKIVSKDPKKAPVGAVHYWDIGKYGHVAGGLGGSRVFMGSKRVQKFWGINVGVTTVEAYTKATGAKYLGWSEGNGRNELNITVPKAPSKKPTAKPKPAKDYKFSLPSKATQVRVQRALGRRRRYFGPADGDMGVNSLKGVQTTLKAKMGYDGKIDGKIESVGCELIQRYAKKYGNYRGPVDKELGENTWIGFALGLEKGN